jgi:hypothetical protein
LDLLLVTAVREDKDPAAVGVLRGYVVEIWKMAVGGEEAAPRCMNFEQWAEDQ